jgi:hypothetical protein
MALIFMQELLHTPEGDIVAAKFSQDVKEACFGPKHFNSMIAD